MKKKSGLIAGIVILILLCIGAGVLYQNMKPAASEGEKHITVTVIHGDQTENVFEFDTDAKYLGEVLESENLVDGESGEYGLFITTVDEETADDSKQQWWCITKGGEQVNTSADQTPVSDGDAFELTLKEGYFITLLFRKNDSVWFWSILSGIYGITFGALCTIPYFAIGGISGAFAYWTSGLLFDIIHCISNFIVCLVLFKPIRYVLEKCIQQIK